MRRRRSTTATWEQALARNNSNGAGAAKSAPAGQAPATNATEAGALAEPTGNSPDESLALHSLQQAHAAKKLFEASDEQLLGFYQQMLLIRRFEEKAGQ